MNINEVKFYIGEFNGAFFFLPAFYFYENQTEKYLLLTFLCFGIGIKWS